jgi:ferritin
MKTQLITQQLAARLHDLARTEFFNAYLYRTLAASMQYAGYFGAQKHFMQEADDEIKHYQAVVDFLNSRGVPMVALALPPLPDAPTTLPDALAGAYNQEVFTENAYKSLGADAQRAGDAPVYQFVMEVMEHQSASTGDYADLITRCNIAGNDPAALLMIDTEIGNLR